MRIKEIRNAALLRARLRRVQSGKGEGVRGLGFSDGGSIEVLELGPWLWTKWLNS